MLATEAPERVYVAGLLTNGGQLNAEQVTENVGAFRRATVRLQSLGLVPVDPTKVIEPGALPWSEAMATLLPHLLGCQVIYLLPGWTTSPGARFEALLASEAGIRYMYAPGAEQKVPTLLLADAC